MVLLSYQIRIPRPKSGAYRNKPIEGFKLKIMSQLDYALIGNCQVSAILDRNARYVWSCLPRFDSPAVFSALLGDKSNGHWTCVPDPSTGLRYDTRQSYVGNTNVLRTEFHLSNGDRFDIIDFAPRFQKGDNYYRPPHFLRIIRPVKGNPRIRMSLKPKFDYGRLEPEINLTSSGGPGITYRGPEVELFFKSDVPTTYLLSEQSFELTTTHYCALTYGEPFGENLKFRCEEYLERTLAYWRTWVKHCTLPFEFQSQVIRSALTLKLHIFEDTGAIIAATTTSVPESPHGGRNWDYRFCWLRDAYFVINVLNQLGHFEEMEKFIQFLHNISVTGPDPKSEWRLQPVYGIGGERELPERELPWLKGFGGMGPVRIGNAAYLHNQYDAYGEMILSVTPLFFDRRLDGMDLHRAFENVVQLVDRAVEVFEKPDAGLWEFRGEQRHYLFSKFMCWAAVDRGLKIADQLGKKSSFVHWVRAEKNMRERIENEGWNEAQGIYTQSWGSTDADASNLLMGAIGFHSGSNPKFRSTVEKYEKLLMKNGYVFRYRIEDDFGVPLHAFTICTFWMVDALVSLGRVSEARVIFERVLACANPVGLLSEDVDPVTNELWGNFPQAYSHVGIINSAFRLSKSWSEAY
jgi:GH15 family glucan-1,4-alpha-glucosidase